MRYFVSILVCNHLDGEERAGCFALLCLSSLCLVIVVWLFLTVPRVCLQFVIVVFPDHTHLLFLVKIHYMMLHIKYQGLMSCGFRQEDLFHVFTLYAHVKHVTHTARTFLDP